MNREMRKETIIGLGLISLYLIINHIVDIPDFLSGLMLGSGIALELLGLVPNDKYKKMKEFKKQLLGRVIH